MLWSASSRDRPLATFAAIALAINLTIALMMRLQLDERRHVAVTVASCFDLLLTVPAIYYFLVIRRGARPFASIWIVAGLGLFRALWLVPMSSPVKPLLVELAKLPRSRSRWRRLNGAARRVYP